MSFNRVYKSFENKNYLEMERAQLQGFSINATDDDFNSLLHFASARKSKTMVNTLLKYGIDINAKNSFNRTPVFNAITNNRLGIIKALFQHGELDLEAIDYTQRTPLLDAVARNREEIALEFLEQGADPLVRDAQGFTPLDYATMNNNPRLAEALIKKGVDINGVDQDKCTALHCAAIHAHEAMLRFLLESGADRILKNKLGETALDMANRLGKCKAIAILSNSS